MNLTEALQAAARNGLALVPVPVYLKSDYDEWENGTTHPIAHWWAAVPAGDSDILQTESGQMEGYDGGSGYLGTIDESVSLGHCASTIEGAVTLALRIKETT